MPRSGPCARPPCDGGHDERDDVSVIARMTHFGATGDLAGRFLLPALVALHAAGRLPAGFTVRGAATQALTDEAFDGPVPDYVHERGVDARRGTETFAELALAAETPRWAGTRFVLRAGKALAQLRREVVLWLRAPDGRVTAPPRTLTIGIDGPHQLGRAVSRGHVLLASTPSPRVSTYTGR